jgi:predicted NUDIX family NTP pyrophosphohydrolase
MSRKSAGILLYRYSGNRVEVFLVHAGGPFWKNRDEGAWSIPKGEFRGEDPRKAALREFREETGKTLREASLTPLSPVRQKSGKTVLAYAVRKDLDPSTVRSNPFQIEWPPGSGKRRYFPEIDRSGWFSLEEAKAKMIAGQERLLSALRSLLEKRGR